MNIIEDMDVSDGNSSDRSDMDIACSDEEGDQGPAPFVPLLQNKTMPSVQHPNNWINENQPLVVEDSSASNSYIIDISDESDGEVEFIEKRYGPFHSSPAKRRNEAPTESPVAVSSPKLGSQSTLVIREREIEILKRKIAEREKTHRAQIHRTAASATSSPRLLSRSPQAHTAVGASTSLSQAAALEGGKDLLPTASSINGNDTTECTSDIGHHSTVTNESVTINNPSATDNPVICFEPKGPNATAEPVSALEPLTDSDPTVIIDSSPNDTIAPLSKDLTSQHEFIPQNVMVNDDPKEDMDVPRDAEDDGVDYNSESDSDNSFYTASGSPQHNVFYDAEQHIDRLERQIEHLNSDSELISHEKKEADLSLVRLVAQVSTQRHRESLNQVNNTLESERGRVGEKRGNAFISTDMNINYSKRPKDRPTSANRPFNASPSTAKGTYRPPAQSHERAFSAPSRKGKERLVTDAHKMMGTETPLMPPTYSPPYSPHSHSPQLSSQSTNFPFHSYTLPLQRTSLPTSTNTAPARSAPWITPTQPAPWLAPARPTPRFAPVRPSPPSSPARLATQLATARSETLSPTERPASPRTPTSQATPIVDGLKLSNYIDDIVSLVKMRLNNYLLVNMRTNKHRTVSGTTRVITVNGFTLRMSDVLHENATLKNVPYNESLLFDLLQKQKTSLNYSNDTANTWMARILQSLPPIDSPSLFRQEQWGSLNFEQTKTLAQEASEACPEVDLFRCLFVEMSLYCNGSSNAFAEDTRHIFGLFPLSIDVVWQRMRLLNKQDPECFNIISGLLKLISRHKSESGATTVSGVTTEVLTRICRDYGYLPVVNLLTGRSLTDPLSTVAAANPITPFSLSDTASYVQLVDYDLYIIWMIVLYKFICQRMPEAICNQWIDTLTSTGRPNTTKPMFTIDWSAVTGESPLSPHEIAGAANILLSMLTYFKNKARSNDTKRPLLIAVWRTIQEFLVYTDCYKAAGVFSLFRNSTEIEALNPDAHEVVISLEARVKEAWTGDTYTHLLSRSMLLSTDQKLCMAYCCARLLRPTRFSGEKVIFRATRLVCLPLAPTHSKGWLNRVPEFVSRETMVAQIDFARKLYLSALDVEQHFPTKKTLQSTLRQAPFSWVILMFLTHIYRWFRDEPLVRTKLAQHLKATRDLGIAAVGTDDAKYLIDKYAEECLATR